MHVPNDAGQEKGGAEGMNMMGLWSNGDRAGLSFANSFIFDRPLTKALWACSSAPIAGG